MVENNTDRLWFTVGAIVVGAIIIYVFRDNVGKIIENLMGKFNANISSGFDEATKALTSSGAQ